MLNSGSPFGDSTGNVYLNGGGLGLQSSNSAPGVVAKNNLSIQGQTALFFRPQAQRRGNVDELQHHHPLNNGILGIYVNGNGTLGGNVQVTVTNPPTNTNGMAPPWILDYYGASFLQYGSTTGFVARDLHRDQQLRRK